MLNRRALALGLIVSFLCVSALAQNGVDKDLLERIRQEEKTHTISELVLRKNLSKKRLCH